jgi:hypothetical protein
MKYLKMLGLAAVAAMALMAVLGASAASATTLEIKGVTQNKSVTIRLSLASGTSAILKDKNGTTNDTCTGSEVEGATTEFDPPIGPISKLTYTGCSHTTDVLANGTLSVTWTSGTNGMIISSGAKVTVKSTVFGIAATCETGAGTVIGTLTGVKEGNATMHINATTLNCGVLGTSSWTGTYIVTSPSGLGAEA